MSKMSGTSPYYLHDDGDEHQEVHTDAVTSQEAPRIDMRVQQACTNAVILCLPSPILHFIFSFLSVRQLFQLRCVCKGWHALLDGKNGGLADSQCKKAEPGDEEIWFVMARPLGQEIWEFMAYSNRSHNHQTETDGQFQGRHTQSPYFKLPLPNSTHQELFSLLGGAGCRHMAVMCKGLIRPSLRTLCLQSAGGFMCAMVHSTSTTDCRKVIVFNCLTGSVRVLPPPLDGGQIMMMLSKKMCYSRLISMAVDSEDTNRYYVMIGENPDSIEIFDSHIGSWKKGRELQSTYFSKEGGFYPWGLQLRELVSAMSSSSKVVSKDALLGNPTDDVHPQLKVMDGDFWWLKPDHSGDIHCILAYHVVYDAWSSVLVQNRHEYWLVQGECTFLKYNGKLFMGHATHTGTDGFEVLELQFITSESGTWVDVASTPEHLLPVPNLGTWQCTLHANGSLFCLSSYDVRYFRPPLVFDVARNSWYKLPLEGCSTKFGCIFMHQPRLSACASSPGEDV